MLLLVEKVDKQMNHGVKVTIFTPLYNRKELLIRLYKSLLHQEDKRFEWLIVDDGSTDQADELINSWINDGKISIRYIYQRNHGKYAAHNKGAENAKGELFFCVDSDDFLPKSSVGDILDLWEKSNLRNKAGILGLKSTLYKGILGDELPSNLSSCTCYDLAKKYQCKGEYSLIYRTEVLKKYKFPEFSDVKFITECVLYDQIDKEYSMLLLNKVLTICEYQLGGYTDNIISLMFKYPIGYQIYYKQRIDMALTFKERAGYVIRYHAFYHMAQKSGYEYSGKHKLSVIFLWPFGWLAYLYYCIKKRR